MDSLLYSGDVEKFSMGRGTGLRAKNWKTRHVKVTQGGLQIFDKSTSSTPKFELPNTSVSLVFATPTKTEHAEASGGDAQFMFAVRFWDKGVFLLLLKAQGAEDKAKWLAALREMIQSVKGAQYVE